VRVIRKLERLVLVSTPLRIQVRRSGGTEGASSDSTATSDLDQQADPGLKVDQLDKLVTLGNQRGVVAIGNVDVTIFARATKPEIEAEVRRCIDTVGTRSRFVLSTSCELPPRANPDCVK